MFAPVCHPQGILDQRNIRNSLLVVNCVLLSAFLVDLLIIIIIINLTAFSTYQPSFDQLKYIREISANIQRIMERPEV